MRQSVDIETLKTASSKDLERLLRSRFSRAEAKAIVSRAKQIGKVINERLSGGFNSLDEEA